MRKQVTICGKVYPLASNAYTPIAYKEQFGKDYFQDLFQMINAKSILDQLNQLEEGEELTAQNMDVSILSDFDMTFFHRLFWVFAKSANPRVKAFDVFFMEMEELPIQEIGPVLMEMLDQGMSTRKKSMKPMKRVKKSSR